MVVVELASVGEGSGNKYQPTKQTSISSGRHVIIKLAFWSESFNLALIYYEKVNCANRNNSGSSTNEGNFISIKLAPPSAT